MNVLATLVDILHWLALTLWVAVLIAAGVAAMGVFSTLPDVGLVLPEFTPYLDATSSDPAADHGRIAAGLVMEPIFTATDFAQIALAALALITLAVQVTVFQQRFPFRRPSNILRGVCIVAATALVAYHTIAMATPMNTALREWREAARQNDPIAAEHRAAFDEDHVIADRLFRIRLVLVLVAVGATAAAAVPLRVPTGPPPNGAELDGWRHGDRR